jgi:hypothetical protein
LKYRYVPGGRYFQKITHAAEIAAIQASATIKKNLPLGLVRHPPRGRILLDIHCFRGVLFGVRDEVTQLHNLQKKMKSRSRIEPLRSIFLQNPLTG